MLRFVSGQRTLDLGHGSEAVLDWVRKRAADRVRVVDLDAMDLELDDLGLGDLDDAAFDVVYSLQTFPHLGTSPDDAEAIARRFLHQAARVCAPGGYVLIQIVNTRSLWGLVTGIRRPITLVSGGTMIERDGAALTRYDTLQRFVGLLPRTLELVDFRGLGIVTPTPRALSLPILGRLVERAEWWLHDRSWPSAFGAHQIAVCRRGPDPSTMSASDLMIATAIGDPPPGARIDPAGRDVSGNDRGDVSPSAVGFLPSDPPDGTQPDSERDANPATRE